MEALGQLTGGIAQDFNNILGIMLGYTELALNRCVQGGQTRTRQISQPDRQSRIAGQETGGPDARMQPP